MDYNQALKTVSITPEEEESIGRYVGFKHVAINMLSNLTSTNYSKLKESWWLPQNEDEVRETIEDFANIYSMMYKNTPENSKYRFSVYRGMPASRTERLGRTFKQFFSTTTDIDIAKTFFKYGDSAILHISVEPGTPYIEPSSYRGEYALDEKEILFAPFTQIDYVRNYGGDRRTSYAHFNVQIRKPNFDDVSIDDLDTLKEDVISGYLQNISDMREYVDLVNGLDFLEEKRKIYSGDKEAQKDIAKEIRQTYSTLMEKIDLTNKYENKMQLLLKGMCKQKELEISKAREVIEIESQKREAKLRAQREEEAKRQAEIHRRQMVSEFNLSLESIPQKTGELSQSIDSAIMSLSQIEQNAINRARKLGIPWENSLQRSDIQRRRDLIFQNFQNLNRKSQTLTLSESSGIEDVDVGTSNIEGNLRGLSVSKDISRRFGSITELHQKQTDEKIKEALFYKVHKAIMNAKIAKYLEDRDAIQSEDIGVFGVINGKKDLQLQELENIKLKMELATYTVPELPSKLSVREMLSDLYVCSQIDLGGRITQEMADLDRAIKSVYGFGRGGQFTDEYIQSISRDKILQRQNLPMVPKSNSRFLGKTKSQIEILKQENEQLSMQIAEERQKENMPRGIRVSQQGDAIATFSNNLAQIETLTREQNVQSRNVIRNGQEFYDN